MARGFIWYKSIPPFLDCTEREISLRFPKLGRRIPQISHPVTIYKTTPHTCLCTRSWHKSATGNRLFTYPAMESCTFSQLCALHHEASIGIRGITLLITSWAVSTALAYYFLMELAPSHLIQALSFTKEIIILVPSHIASTPHLKARQRLYSSPTVRFPASNILENNLTVCLFDTDPYPHTLQFTHYVPKTSSDNAEYKRFVSWVIPTYHLRLGNCLLQLLSVSHPLLSFFIIIRTPRL